MLNRKRKKRSDQSAGVKHRRNSSSYTSLRKYHKLVVASSDCYCAGITTECIVTTSVYCSYQTLVRACVTPSLTPFLASDSNVILYMILSNSILE